MAWAAFREAIETAYPRTLVQTCIVHLIRNSMAYGSWKERKRIAAALKAIYQAENADAALAALEAFEAGEWGRKYPAIAKGWRRQWEQVIPFFAFSAPIRRAIYTTNAVESLNSTVRRAVREQGPLPPRRRGQEADLPGPAGRCGQVEAAAPVLVAGEGRVCNPLRGAVHYGARVSAALVMPISHPAASPARELPYGTPPGPGTPPAGMGSSRGSLTNQGADSLNFVEQLTHKVSDTPDVLADPPLRVWKYPRARPHGNPNQTVQLDR